MQKVVQVTLASAVAQNGTFTAGYPTGYSGGSFATFGHYIIAHGLQAQFSTDEGTISISFGASTATITYKGATSIPANSVVVCNFNVAGESSVATSLPGVNRSVLVATVRMDLGAPTAAAAAGVAASQSVAAAGSFLLNGSISAGGRMILDVPRALVGAWTTTSVLTVTGKDEYGNTVIEQSASGATFTGKKAFKEITSVTSSAAITAATLGTGDVLGLPIYLSSSALIIKELESGAAATAGTTVAGVQTTPTATTGDVRGTYDPASACDGSKAFSIVAQVSEPTYRGVNQYDG